WVTGTPCPFGRPEPRLLEKVFHVDASGPDHMLRRAEWLGRADSGRSSRAQPRRGRYARARPYGDDRDLRPTASARTERDTRLSTRMVSSRPTGRFLGR